MFVEGFRLLGAEHSVHFSESGRVPCEAMRDERLLVLELDGGSLRTKSDLIGCIENGVECPWFVDADVGTNAAGNGDSFLDVLRSWDEWLSIAGVVVVVRGSREAWSRMYPHFGALIEVWLWAAEFHKNWSSPMHLVFSDEPFASRGTGLALNVSVRSATSR